MKKTFRILCALTLFLSTLIKAQIGGNHLYENTSVHYNRTPVEATSIYSTDSTLIVSAKVLLNKKAASYRITIGANQIGKTVAETNLKLKNRINNVVKKIKGLGIKENDIYVDFISETKLYDHEITNRDIIEYLDGFSIRKNIIIQIKNLELIDKIIDYCAEEEIHDIIKVDYISEDLEVVNENIFEEAMKRIERKKKLFEKSSSVEVSNDYRLVYEKFHVFYPKNLYKQYEEAHESTIVQTNYNSSYNRKEARKERTFYYDGVETELGLNQIIGEDSPIVGIQYMVEIQMVYILKR